MSQRESSIPKDTLQSALRRGLRNDRIVVTDVVTTNPSLGGEHYMSEIEYCDIDIDVDGVKRKVNLFIKKEFNQEKQAKNNAEGISTSAFVTEIAVYDVLLRDIVDFCRKNETTPIDTDFFPLCFYTSKTDKKMLLAMENLVSAGYKMHEGRMLCQDLRHAKLVMTSLATFHAASYVMQEKTGVNFAKKYNLSNMMDSGTTFFETMTHGIFNVVVNVLKDTPDCVEMARKMEKFAPHVVTMYQKYFYPGDGINVLCHGDCWNNNMLFLYNKIEEPVKVKFVDWQGTHPSPLFRDLYNFVFISVKMELRRKCLPELLRTYYDQFSRTAHSLGAGDVMFSYERFLQENRKSKLFALTIGLMSTIFGTIMDGVSKEKEENSGKDFDLGYLLQNCNDPQLITRLSEQMRNELVEIVKENEQELDAYLSTV